MPKEACREERECRREGNSRHVHSGRVKLQAALALSPKVKNAPVQIPIPSSTKDAVMSPGMAGLKNNSLPTKVRNGYCHLGPP